MASFPRSITTERLRLRQVTIDDAGDVFEYASDPEVTQYLTFPCASSLHDVLPYLANIERRFDTDQQFHWAITLAGSVRLIGMISASRDHGLKLGYVLKRRFWGRGYMTEAVRAIITWAFEVDGAYRVWATCDVDNEKSAAVMRKAGMKHEGTLHRWDVHPNVSAEPRESLVLAIYR